MSNYWSNNWNGDLDSLLLSGLDSSKSLLGVLNALLELDFLLGSGEHS